MTKRSSLDGLSATFADQFEPDGANFIYRRHMTGPAFRVSAAEREAFIHAYQRRMRISLSSLVAAVVILIVLGVGLIPDLEGSEADFAYYALLGITILAILVIVRWAWNAPARDLDRRTPMAPALSKDEARRLTFARISYAKLAAVAIVAAALAVGRATDEDGSALWLAVAVGLPLLAAVQAFRKWRFERG